MVSACLRVEGRMDGRACVLFVDRGVVSNGSTVLYTLTGLATPCVAAVALLGGQLRLATDVLW